MMLALRRAAQVTWLVLLGIAAVLQPALTDPLGNPADAIATAGLAILFGTHLLLIWRWLSLSLRKLWMWVSNSSCAWSLEAKWRFDEIDDDGDLLATIDEELGARWPAAIHAIDHAATRLQFSIPRQVSAMVSIEEADHDIVVRLVFDGMSIGYRDAMQRFNTVVSPVIERVEDVLPHVQSKSLGLVASVRGSNPFFDVFAAQAQLKTAEAFFLRFTHRSGASVTMTGKSIEVSATDQTSLAQAMAAVFGLSLRGAIDANHL